MTMQIYSAIIRVMADVGAVAKSRRNPQQGYQFRGIDDVYNAIRPALVKHGVFCAPRVVRQVREERQSRSGGALVYTVLTVRHRFYAADGSYVDVITVGEGMDSGDKSANKAMSAAMKYALIELLAIPTEDNSDSEMETHEIKSGAAVVEPADSPPTPATRQPRHLSEKLVDEFCERLNSTITTAEEAEQELSLLSALWNGMTNEQRKMLERGKDARVFELRSFLKEAK